MRMDDRAPRIARRPVVTTLAEIIEKVNMIHHGRVLFCKSLYDPHR